MTLTETGESRIRGYLFVLGRSLRAFLPAEVVDDAVREVESHVRERMRQMDAGDTAERDVVERVLAELGPPLRVAQAYSQEMTLDEAVTTGRFVSMLRALWHTATTSVYGFAWGIFVLLGWGLGLALLTIGILKPIFPNNVGFIVTDGAPGPGLHVPAVPLAIARYSLSLSAQFPLPPEARVYGGYWVVLVSILAGLLVLVFTHRLSRRVLGWLRSRTSPGRLRVRLVVETNEAPARRDGSLDGDGLQPRHAAQGLAWREDATRSDARACAARPPADKTMNLTETGESRIAGYLYLLRQSLRSFLRRDVADDAVREVESHIRERLEQIEARERPRSPAEADVPGRSAKAGERIEQIEGREGPRSPAEADVLGRSAKAGVRIEQIAGPTGVMERDAVERVLAELGPPLRVAQAYSQEMTLDEAVTTGRFVPMLRALWHLATTSVFGFGWALFVFVGWTMGIAFLAVGVIKVILPNNVGLFVLDGKVVGAGAEIVLQPGVGVHPFGYWVVPVSLAIGLLILVGTQRASRRVLSWMRSRKAPARLRLRVEVKDAR